MPSSTAPSITVYGTVTSPYVRRVRVALLELGQPFGFVDVVSGEGQARMRAVNPLWKIPAVEIDDTVIFDSRVIVNHLIERYGSDGTLRIVAPDDPHTHNTITAIDGVLDALINVLYLGRDSVTPADSSYLTKQGERSRAAMTWLDGRVDDVWLGPARQFGLAELALCTMMGWMRFRDAYPIEQHPNLMRCFEHHDARASLVSTHPSIAL